jgi:hypothetical protein
MRRLAGARVFRPTAAPCAHMRALVRSCYAHARARPDDVKRLSIFGHLYSFLTLLQCCGINLVP